MSSGAAGGTVGVADAIKQYGVGSAGDMARDLTILIRADRPWLTANQFLDKLDINLQKAMA